MAEQSTSKHPPDETPELHENVVVGGGPAGAALAALLARAGRRVLLLERESEPRDKLCGEFLSGEAQQSLRQVGLDVAALGGHAVRRMRLESAGSTLHADLPFPALGLTRRTLDAALLSHAEACGAEVRRGSRVTLSRLADSGGPFLLQPWGGRPIATRHLFLATGKHDLRPLQRRPEGPTWRRSPERPEGGWLGYKMHYRLAEDQMRRLRGTVELLLHDGGYAGLQRVEGGRANLCLLVRRGAGGAGNGETPESWEEAVRDLQRRLPHVERRLDGAQALLPRPLSVAHVPYGWMHRSTAADAPGLYRLGDQAAVIPSFCGDGMAIALHSAQLAALAHLRGAGAAAYHERLHADLRAQIRRAMWLQRAGSSATGRALLFGVAALWPGALNWAAQATRVAPAARQAVTFSA